MWHFGVDFPCPEALVPKDVEHLARRQMTVLREEYSSLYQQWIQILETGTGGSREIYVDIGYADRS
jgi:hypothetical protein